MKPQNLKFLFLIKRIIQNEEGYDDGNPPNLFNNLFFSFTQVPLEAFIGLPMIVSCTKPWVCAHSLAYMICTKPWFCAQGLYDSFIWNESKLHRSNALDSSSSGKPNIFYLKGVRFKPYCTLLYALKYI